MDEQRLAEILARLDRRLRRFEVGQRCADCLIGHPLLLCRSGDEIVCHDCRLKRRGRLPSELHHIGGRPSELTVQIPANLHRLLSSAQDLWREWLEPGSKEAQLIDLILLRHLGPLFGVTL
jgi:hypothetical protein